LIDEMATLQKPFPITSRSHEPQLIANHLQLKETAAPQHKQEPVYTANKSCEMPSLSGSLMQGQPGILREYHWRPPTFELDNK